MRDIPAHQIIMQRAMVMYRHSHHDKPAVILSVRIQKHLASHQIAYNTGKEQNERFFFQEK